MQEDNAKNTVPPLITAIRNEKHALTENLLRDPTTDVNATDPNGYTALHVAAQKRNVDLVRLLLQKGANAKAIPFDYKTTALHLAVEKLKSPTINEENIEAIVLLLLDAGADPKEVNSSGETPLHLAASGFSLNIAGILLDHQADLEAKDCTGQTPLGSAMYYWRAEMVSFLVKRGADVNAFDQHGYTIFARGVFHCFGKEAQTEVLAAIQTSKNLDVHAVNDTGQTALHMLAGNESSAAFQYVLDLNLDVNAVDKEGTTPLHIAAQEDCLEHVKLLVKKGANIVANNNGNYPIDLTTNVLIRQFFIACQVQAIEDLSEKKRQALALFPKLAPKSLLKHSTSMPNLRCVFFLREKKNRIRVCQAVP